MPAHSPSVAAIGGAAETVVGTGAPGSFVLAGGRAAIAGQGVTIVALLSRTEMPVAADGIDDMNAITRGASRRCCSHDVERGADNRDTPLTGAGIELRARVRIEDLPVGQHLIRDVGPSGPT